MQVRKEKAEDRAAIYALHAASFPSEAEANLVDQLRGAKDVAISLLAQDEERIIGHVLFSPLSAPFRALGLGPIAVTEAWRRQGVATRLIEAGLAEAKNTGWDAVFVLGDPAYYQRFGFSAELAAGFVSPYGGPHFMALALQGVLSCHDGHVDYAPAFAALDF